MATTTTAAAPARGQAPLQYFAIARNARGRIEQILVTKLPGKPTSPEWTGKVYKTQREADADIARLNVEIAARRARP